jgi:hypothetical protein
VFRKRISIQSAVFVKSGFKEVTVAIPAYSDGGETGDGRYKVMKKSQISRIQGFSDSFFLDDRRIRNPDPYLCLTDPDFNVPDPEH